jgi:hypothetical protein
MLGLEPLGDHLVVDPALPRGIGELELLDIPGRWGRLDAYGRGRIEVDGRKGSRQLGLVDEIMPRRRRQRSHTTA